MSGGEKFEVTAWLGWEEGKKEAFRGLFPAKFEGRKGEDEEEESEKGPFVCELNSWWVVEEKGE